MTDKKIPKELINNWFKDKMNFSLNNEQLNDLCSKIDNYAKINFVCCCETLKNEEVNKHENTNAETYWDWMGTPLN